MFMSLRLIAFLDIDFKFERLPTSRKLDLWPLITGSNIDLGKETQYQSQITIACREQSIIFFLLSSKTLSFESRQGRINSLLTDPSYEKAVHMGRLIII